MTFTLKNALRLAVLVAASHVLSVGAQTPNNVPVPAQPDRTNLNASERPSPPLPSGLKPPVEFFRELLAMNVAERNQALADRSPEIRKRILAKVREYQSLKSEDRELRLRITELHWYLLPLIKLPLTNRNFQLEAIPEKDRALVQDRLAQWDRLPAAFQQELLTNYFVVRHLEAGAWAQKPPTLDGLSPARLRMLQAGIRQWQDMPEDKRRKIMARFEQIFELPPQEKERTLNTLSEPERRQIEKTLNGFKNLTPAQRAQCIRSFEKFAGLSVAERQQFLKNADRWKLMKPEERRAWRDIVAKAPIWPMPVISPPLPVMSPPLPNSMEPKKTSPQL